MSLESELDQQYIKLSDDIRSSIDDQDAQFIEMSKNQYGDENYQEDREDYLIEQKINDLSQKREAIWNYLNKEYQENTKERKLNFKLLSQREKDIEKQVKEIKNLKQDKEQITTKDNIRNRNIGHQKFIAKRHDYYFYLYKLIAVVLIMTSFVLAISLYGYVSKQTAIQISTVSMLVLLSYSVYYIVIRSFNRDKFDWDAYYFKGESLEDSRKRQKQVCETPVSEEDQEMNRLENEAGEILKKYGSKKCPNGKNSNQQTS